MQSRTDPPTGSEIVQDLLSEPERAGHAREVGTCFHEGLLEAIPAVVWACDRAGHVEYVNRRWREFTGLTLQAINEDGFEAVVHPDDRPLLRAAWRQALLTGEGFTEEIRCRRRDGSHRCFLVTASPTHDAGREATLWVFMLYDPAPDVAELAPCAGATGRCAASTTLARANERLDMVLDAAGAGLWDWDPTTGRVEWSRQLYRLLGLAPGEVVPCFSAWQEAVHPDDREKAIHQVEVALCEHSFLTGEYRVVWPDGQVRWIHVLGQGTYDRQGRAVRMSALCLDVTSRKEAEEAVRLSEEKFSALFFGNSALMTLTGLRDGRLVEVNQRALERFGFTREDAVGRTISELMVYRDPEVRVQAVHDLQELGKFTDREIEFVARDGEVWVALMSSEVIRLRGEFYIISSLWDITDRKKAEQAVQSLNVELEATVSELRKSNERLSEAREVAESASRMKSEFLALMSHEIRTPLNGVMGMQSLLLESDLAPREHEMVTLAQTSAKALLLVLSDILDMSRLEADRLVLEPAPFDIFQLAGEVMALQAASARDRGIELTVDFPLHATCKVLGDSGRLRQVLANLVGNAVKFTHAGHVRVGVEVAPSKQNEVAVVIRVEDTGIGIPRSHLDTIFAPFVQVDAGLARRYGGSGLGLALCKKLLDMMGGNLSVDSCLGEGSCFVVELTLPLVREEKPDTAEARPIADGVTPVEVASRLDGAWPVTSEPGPGTAAGVSAVSLVPHVLLVEDNNLNQKITAALLQRLGCTVDVASNGMEAVARVAAQEYDLIFMDCQMPIMDGFQATAEIRRLPDARAGIPVVALTAHVLEGDRQRCLDAGMNDYLAKPLEVAHIEAALDRWLWSRLPAEAFAPT